MSEADAALEPFHPLVREWFAETFGAPSAPQREGWPAIARGAHTLILAPTGTGKTLAAFLSAIDTLIREGIESPLANAVHLLYVSPLKALGNDIQKNLEEPLAALRARFLESDQGFPDIRVAVRTGDTPPSARARMIRKTPHILITTPESLHLLLTSASGRTMFSALRTVIVDEIHAVAGTKRGAHLALTLERLADVAPHEPQRIGLSATQRPLDEIARFLGGCDIGDDGTPRFRPVTIVDCGMVKAMATQVLSPVDDLAHVDGSIWNAVVPLVIAQVREARTTLVFVNNRAQAERIARRLNAESGEELAQPYHGSLSRDRRLHLEQNLKAGAIRALVTTSSLELGIDVGSVDLVIQLQSPKRVSAALQRIGRAGHTLNATSRGVFVPTFRDDAVEELAIVRAMEQGDVEPTRVVQHPLDVLAQLIVAMVASDTPEWTASALFNAVRRAYPFHALPRTAFDETLAMVSGHYPATLAAELEARVHWDRSTDRLTPSRSARMVATISGGTIPDRGLYAVYLADRTRLGELDEEFVHESRVGDAFQLGSSTWRIRAIEHDRVVVTPASGAPARLPFWHGEFMARSFHLSGYVGSLRRALADAGSDDDLAEIARQHHGDEATVRSLAEYVRTQRELTGVVPDDRTIVTEWFRDETGGVRIVMHASFGGRVTAPWGMALGRKMHQRLGVDIPVQTTDDGVMLKLPNLGADPPLDLLRNVSAAEARQLVVDAVGESSLFGARFRMNAARALLLPRGSPRRRMPLWLQRLKAADLLQAVRGFPSFPIVLESYRDVLQDAFDLDALHTVLDRIGRGEIGWHTVHTSIPSPFAQSLQFGFVMEWMYGDDTPRAEERAALLSLDRALLDELLGGRGADERTLEVLEEVLARRRGTAPGRQARDADELAILLDRAGDLTRDELRQRVAPPPEWSRGDPLAELLSGARVGEVTISGETRIVLSDAVARYRTAIDPAASDDSAVRDEARREILVRHVLLASPFAVADVARRYPFDPAWVAGELADLAARDMLVRGRFGDDPVERWCARRALELARRRELAQVRAQIAPASIEHFAVFLQRWQHVAAGERVAADDAADVVKQLLGMPRPPLAWERDYFPLRVEDWTPALLDRMLDGGRMMWSVSGAPAGGPPRLRFFERGSGRIWLPPIADTLELSDGARAVRTALERDGASFIEDLASATGFAQHRLHDALRELVYHGVATNDTAGGMRAVLEWMPVFAATDAPAPDPARWLPDTFVVQRRVNVRRLARWRRPDDPRAPVWGGRWALVHTAGALGPPRDEQEMAEVVTRQLLRRYGIVSHDWWQRERPQIPWRSIYRELKRLEYRGEVQRGYFVAGLRGAQFALSDAVSLLRTSDESPQAAAPVAFAGSDPCNVFALPVEGVDAFARPRGGAAVLVTRAGHVEAVVERGAKRWHVAPEANEAQRADALGAAARYLMARGDRRHRAPVIEALNGEVAARTTLGALVERAGFRREPGRFRYHGP